MIYALFEKTLCHSFSWAEISDCHYSELCQMTAFNCYKNEASFACFTMSVLDHALLRHGPAPSSLMCSPGCHSTPTCTIVIWINSGPPDSLLNSLWHHPQPVSKGLYQLKCRLADRLWLMVKLLEGALDVPPWLWLLPHGGGSVSGFIV